MKTSLTPEQKRQYIFTDTNLPKDPLVEFSNISLESLCTPVAQRLAELIWYTHNPDRREHQNRHKYSPNSLVGLREQGTVTPNVIATLQLNIMTIINKEILGLLLLDNIPFSQEMRSALLGRLYNPEDIERITMRNNTEKLMRQHIQKSYNPIWEVLNRIQCPWCVCNLNAKTELQKALDASIAAMVTVL